MVFKKLSYYILCFFLLTSLTGLGQSPPNQKKQLDFSAATEVGVVSKYIWRGQRLTDDWSLQPTGTATLGNFSFNVWGNLDLASVNEGDALFIPENPAAPPGNHGGLQGKFSEIDYTFSYAIPTSKAAFELGSIIYTFPERSASLPSTTEIYGGINLDRLPLSPTATLYVDVDETGAGAGDTGMYFLLGGGHEFILGYSRFPGIGFSGTLSFVNSGFSQYYYGASRSGAHDVNLTLTAPINIGERVSASAFISYSALLGDFRNYQFRDPREVFRGTAGSPASFADTVWGGMSLSLEF